MPRIFWAYQPPSNDIPVGDLPADTNGYVTFTSVNNFTKVTPQVQAMWARLLMAVPKSQLIIQSAAGNSVAAQERVPLTFYRRGCRPRPAGISALVRHGRLPLAARTVRYHTRSVPFQRRNDHLPQLMDGSPGAHPCRLTTRLAHGAQHDDRHRAAGIRRPTRLRITLPLERELPRPAMVAPSPAFDARSPEVLPVTGWTWLYKRVGVGVSDPRSPSGP